MKEIRTIINAYKKIDFSIVQAALATVVRVDGSSYRREGARMLVMSDGTYIGGISGGCLEADVHRKTLKAIIKNKPSLITYDTTQGDEHQIGVGLGCNGIIDVLITPLNPFDEQNPVCLLSEIVATRKEAVIISVTGVTENEACLGKTIMYKNDKDFFELFPITAIAEFVLKDLKECISNQKSKTYRYNNGEEIVTLFIEVIVPAIRLIVYGGNYDIHPLACIAKELGWEVMIVSAVTKTGITLSSMAELFHPKAKENLVIDAYTAILLMSHNYQTDLENFQGAIYTKAFYIGLLGPRKRSQKIFDCVSIKNNEALEESMHRIFAPAGLDIGAITPEEIALSILAEIKSCNSGRAGNSLKLRQTAIHKS